MRQLLLRRHALRFALAGCLVASFATAIGVGVGCGPVDNAVWVCLNPVTGKLDVHTYDAAHYVNGVSDPCHCYDPCGPTKTCPIVVDAGPPTPGCDAGEVDDGGT